MAARINERFAGAAHPPIVLLVEHHQPQDIYEYYRAAELCMVTSLHDGMNLVAKEFVSARDDERGVLILSQFTGAARELPEALIVNPYDTDQCTAALQTALVMPAGEQRARIRLMRGGIQECNVYRWAGRRLIDAAGVRRRGRRLERRHRPPVSRHPLSRGRPARRRAARRGGADFPSCVSVPRVGLGAPPARRRRRPPPRVARRGQGSLAGAALPAGATVGGLRPP